MWVGRSGQVATRTMKCFLLLFSSGRVGLGEMMAAPYVTYLRASPPCLNALQGDGALGGLCGAL